MSDTTATPDAVDLLTADHAEVEEMFRQIESSPEGDARNELVAGVHRELSVHADIEERQRVKEALAAIERAGTPEERNPQELGSKLASAKKMAPTHPHPRASNTLPATSSAVPPRQSSTRLATR